MLSMSLKLLHLSAAALYTLNDGLGEFAIPDPMQRAGDSEYVGGAQSTCAQ